MNMYNAMLCLTEYVIFHVDIDNAVIDEEVVVVGLILRWLDVLMTK